VLASDLTIATSGAIVGLPEPRRALVAGIVSPLLVFRIGASQAARMLFTARSFDAAEAQRMGLYHEVVADETLLPRAARGGNRERNRRERARGDTAYQAHA
jgi:methylglutaconyl-CoA hydratase